MGPAIRSITLFPTVSQNSKVQHLLTYFTSLIKMKLATSFLALAGSAAAFAPVSNSNNNNIKATSLKAFTVDQIPGALAPVGLFDPLGFAEKADEATLKRYREAEVTHGRVAMLAVSKCLNSKKLDGSCWWLPTVFCLTRRDGRRVDC